MTVKTDTPYSTKKFYRYYLQSGVSIEHVDNLLGKQGTVLSEEQGRCLRQIERFIVEDVTASLGASRSHRLKGMHIWSAGCALRDYGIPVIMPAAYVEKRILGRITGYSLIIPVPEGMKDAKNFLSVLLKWTNDKQTVERYLSQLARAVQRIWRTNCFHAQLWGHNILTQNGQTFFFTGLEAVEEVEDYTDDMFLDNLIQLYDSFRNILNDNMLVPFMTQLLGEDRDPRIWMPKVRKGYEDLLVERAEEEESG